MWSAEFFCSSPFLLVLSEPILFNSTQLFSSTFYMQFTDLGKVVYLSSKNFVEVCYLFHPLQGCASPL